MMKRVRWLDSCKGFAAILVVLGHVTNGYLGVIFPEQQGILRNIYDLIYAFHMPLFFILSGYSFGLAYKTETGLKRKKVQLQLGNLVWQYLVFSSMFWFLQWLCTPWVKDPVSVQDLKDIFIRPIELYWYLYVLIFFYLMALCFDTRGIWNNKALFLGSFAVSGVIYGLSLPSVFSIKNALYYFFFFYFGICAVEHPQFICLNKTWRVLCGAGAAATLIFTYFLNGDLRAVPVLGVFGPLVISVAVMDFFQWTFSGKRKGVLGVLGTYALEIYVTHSIIIAGNRVILPKLGITQFALNVAVNTAMATLIPVGCAWILKKMGLHTLIFRPATFFAGRKKARS